MADASLAVHASVSRILAEFTAGDRMYDFVREVFPICRSITGNGVRQTLARIRARLPDLEVHEIPTGTKCFDWDIPPEWNIRDAFVEDQRGKRVIDFRENNLHVVGYSIPVDVTLSMEELSPHLHSLPEQPEAIPYVTSYYRRTWGFCLAHTVRQRLERGRYRAVIDSTLEPGSLTYADLLLPGEDEREVLISTYICHPSMANNELSGPAVATELAAWLTTRSYRRFSYRFVFVPETIGSIAYLSRNLSVMKERTVAGFMLSCVGDDRSYSFLPSRNGDTLADRVALAVLRHHAPGFKSYSFLQRGSDERQYCSPTVDLPVATLSRSKFEEFPEYHTSLDDLSVVTAQGLSGSLTMMQRCVEALENNWRFRMTVHCEPQLSKRDLYPTTSTKNTISEVADILNFIAYCDGERDLVNISEIIGLPVEQCVALATSLASHGLLSREAC